jgi:hypothetical protein
VFQLGTGLLPSAPAGDEGRELKKKGRQPERKSPEGVEKVRKLHQGVQMNHLKMKRLQMLQLILQM